MSELTWTHISGKGYGVIATQVLKRGATLEVSPITPISESHSQCEALRHHNLAWLESEPGRERAIGFGYLMLYNHSDDPNIIFRYHFRENKISVIALRDIEPQEELTVDYGCELWFEPVTVTGTREIL